MPTWDEKRLLILKRDNFTCNLCGNFNPGIGAVEIITDAGQLEIHEYNNHPDPDKIEYTVSCSSTGHTFIFIFGGCWPVFPVLQVHHLRYIEGKEQWDYDDEYLTTLCASCHSRLHDNTLIPRFNPDMVLLDEKLYPPYDIGNGHRYDVEDMTFVRKHNLGHYIVADIAPTIKFVRFGHENEELLMEEGQSVLDSLIRKYFPRYS